MPSLAAIPTQRRELLTALAGRRFVLACMALSLALRLPFVPLPLGIDEGGYAFVAASWGEGHGGIYGGQWVDRPPLLIALYALALQLAGDIGIRLLGCLAAVVVVGTCADAAGRLAGPRAMRWSALVASVLASSTAIQSTSVNAELPAIAFTSLATWLVVLAATGPSSRGVSLAVASGLAAMGAVLVKQSFVDGFAFAFAFLVAWGALARREDGRRAAGTSAALAVAGLFGAGVALSATVAWAELRGPGFGPLLDALYGFRLEARDAIERSPEAPATRGWFLLALAAVTGMLGLFAFVVFGLGRLALTSGPGGPSVLARAGAVGLLAMGAMGLMGIVVGGNWWLHYLIQLTPFLALGTGIVVAVPRRRDIPGRVVRRARRWALVVATTSTLAWCGTLISVVLQGSPQRTPMAVGGWLEDAARPGDTAIVAWGHANVLHRSGLDSPYRLSWSLPIRVHDPELEELFAVLSGPEAPTWIVEWRPFSSWDLDRGGRVRRLVDERYEQVPSVCGKTVHRLRSRSADTLPPDPQALGQCGSARGLSVGTVKLI